MDIHLLSGFLGSGKTTAIQSACRILSEKGIKAAVITNDQGIRLVDAGLFKQLGIPGRQVLNGCFCCNYRDLDNQIQSLLETAEPEVIFAESVGSCTDIVATVFKPLRVFRPDVRVTLSVFADAMLLHLLLIDKTFLFDEEVNYIYFKQLEESNILIISKMDLLNSDELRDLKNGLNERYPDKLIHYQDSRNDDQVRQWLGQLEPAVSDLNPRSLEMDYAKYGAGEAKLAWLDQELDIESSNKTATRDAIQLMQEIFKKIAAEKHPIGHLKYLLNGQQKISFTSSSLPEIGFEILPAVGATLLLNARVQTSPGALSLLVSDAIRTFEEQSGCRVRTNSISSFQPGFPTPTCRME
ncbi:MAG TPA: GTP-binding protein [Puia sp.]|jgi:G3E family GTPase